MVSVREFDGECEFVGVCVCVCEREFDSMRECESECERFDGVCESLMASMRVLMVCVCESV